MSPKRRKWNSRESDSPDLNLDDNMLRKIRNEMPPGVTDDEIRESYYQGGGWGKDSVSFKNKDV